MISKPERGRISSNQPKLKGEKVQSPLLLLLLLLLPNVVNNSPEKKLN